MSFVLVVELQAVGISLVATCAGCFLVFDIPPLNTLTSVSVALVICSDDPEPSTDTFKVRSRRPSRPIAHACTLTGYGGGSPLHVARVCR